MNSNNIKSLVQSSLLALSLAAGAAGAAPITVDVLLGEATPANSKPSTELGLLNNVDVDGVPVGDWLGKLEKDKDGFITPVARDGAWVINLSGSTPGYFVLKFGGGNLPTGASTHYLFQNIGNKNELVFTNAQIDYIFGLECSAAVAGSCNVGRLSHFSFTANVSNDTLLPPDGNPQPQPPKKVPEPASLALLGLGLAGLAFGRRKA